VKRFLVAATGVLALALSVMAGSGNFPWH